MSKPIRKPKPISYANKKTRGYQCVYLLHFERPVCNGARHYVGWTKDLDNRVRVHRSGLRGSVLTRAAARAGVPFLVARTWQDGGAGPGAVPESLRKVSSFVPPLSGGLRPVYG